MTRKPWKNASAQFDRSGHHFCRSGRKFAKGKTLGRAWQTCKNGYFMVHWLRVFRGVRSFALDVLCDVDSEVYARNIRAAFNPDGSQR